MELEPEPVEPDPSYAGPAPGLSLLDRLGPRAQRRATPRLGPVLGGSGALLAFIGLVMLSFDTSDIEEATLGRDSKKMVGFLLCAAGIAAGYALIAFFRAGGLGAFGSVTAVLLVPIALFFLTFDAADAPPFPVDVVLLVSALCWLAGYAFGPSRGRPFWLGAAATGLWLFLLEAVENLFTSPFTFFPAVFFVGDESGRPPELPDATVIGVISLLFAIACFAGAWLLEANAARGAATPLLAVGFVTLFVGFFSLTADIEPAGAGILLAAGGLAIVVGATRIGRRGSAWLGGLAVAMGLAWIVGDAFEDSESVTGLGLTLMVVGAAVALAADRFAAASNEPSELALPDAPDAGGPPPPGPFVL